MQSDGVIKTQRPPNAPCVKRGSYCEDRRLRASALMAGAMRGLCDQLPMPRQLATRYLPGGVMLCMHPPLVDHPNTLRLVHRNVKQVTAGSMTSRQAPQA